MPWLWVFAFIWVNFSLVLLSPRHIRVCRPFALYGQLYCCDSWKVGLISISDSGQNWSIKKGQTIAAAALIALNWVQFPKNRVLNTTAEAPQSKKRINLLYKY